MKVRIPSVLFSYTGRKAEVEGTGENLAAVLADLDRRYPGLRFRVVDEQDGVRQHIVFFVNGQKATDLAQPVGPADEVMIVAALSGG